jgi:hypothetical protein
MALDLSKLTDEQLDAYRTIVAGRKASADMAANPPAIGGGNRWEDVKMEEATTPQTVLDRVLQVPVTAAFGTDGRSRAALSRYQQGTQSAEEKAGNKNVNKRLLGAVIPGGAFLKTMSGAAGVETPGELAVNLAGGPLAKLGARGTQAAGRLVEGLPFGKDMAKTGLAMLLGLGQHEANTAVNNAAGGNQQSSLFQQNGGQDTTLAQVVSTLLPGVGSAISNAIKNNKFSKAKQLLTELRGEKTDPRSVSSLPVEDAAGKVQPGVRDAVDTRIFAEEAPIREVADQIADKRRAVGEMDVRLRRTQNNLAKEAEKRGRIIADIDNVTAEKKAELSLLKKEASRITKRDPIRAQEMQEQIEQRQSELLRLGEQKRGLKSNKLDLPETEVPLGDYKPRSVRTLLENARTTRATKAARDAEIDDLAATHKAMQDRIRDNSGVSASLRSFGSAATPTEFVGQIRKASADQLGEMFSVLTSPSERESMRRAVLDDFTRLAFPKGQVDPEALRLYTPEKIGKLFGEGVEATDASIRVQNLVGKISELVAPSKSKGQQIAEGVARKFANVSVPGYIMFHGMPGPHTAAVAGTAVIAIAWPKLIDAVVKNKKFGDEFMEWASTGESARHSLETFPAVRKWLIANDAMEGTETRLSEGVKSNARSVKDILLK